MGRIEGYDYIVVGAGSGGCVVASRLSEDPAVRVCLIEDGGPDTSPLVNVPAGAAALVPSRLSNYAYETTPQPGLNGRRGYQPRGRVLGGCSAINAMCYVRGQAQDYDDWAAAGLDEWDWSDVLPDFRLSENNERGADDFHGVGGPLNVADQRCPSEATRLFVEACVEHGLHRNPDFNGARQDGAGLYQVNQKNGRRHSAARAFLHPAMTRPNLTILTKTRALRVVMENGRAVGVEVARGGRVNMLAADHGVVAAAGVFGTPQLLMLSGIGDADDLKPHGVASSLHLPGVGRNLHDHPDYTLLYRSTCPDLFGIDMAGMARTIGSIPRFLRDGTGPLSSNYAEGGAFLSTTGGRPDVQLHFVPGMLEDHARKIEPGRGFTIHVCVLRPESRGNVRLASADPRVAPLIDPNFLATDHDVQTLLRGFRILRDIVEGSAMEGIRGEERHTRGLTTDADLIAALRARADTVYHPVGSCRMGMDEGAVCDARLKVRGADNLWIADGSVMPSIVSGNTHAATVMIGERAARYIRQDARAA